MALVHAHTLAGHDDRMLLVLLGFLLHYYRTMVLYDLFDEIRIAKAYITSNDHVE